MAFRNKFKSGLDGKLLKSKRMEVTVQLRKQKREEQVQSKRRIDQDSKTTDADLQRLPEYAKEIKSGIYNFETIRNVRYLCNKEKNPPLDEIVKADIIQDLIKICTMKQHSDLHVESLWILTNIASGQSCNVQLLLEHNVLPVCVETIKSTDLEIKDQTIWLLANIAGDCDPFKLAVLESGILPWLLELFVPTTNTKFLRNATWTLSNMCRGRVKPTLELATIVLPYILRLLLTCQDVEVLSNLLYTLQYISDDDSFNNSKVQKIIELGMCETIVKFLQHPSVEIYPVALQIVGNIFTGDDLQMQGMLNCNPLQYFPIFICNPQSSIRMTVYWSISNVMAGNEYQIQTILNIGVMDTLMKNFQHEKFLNQREIAFAFTNFTNRANTQQLEILMSEKERMIAFYCKMLTLPDNAIVQAVLQSLEVYLGKFGNTATTLIEECGGLYTLEHLQKHENEAIYDMAVSLLTRFFNEEDQGEEDSFINHNGETEYRF